MLISALTSNAILEECRVICKSFRTVALLTVGFGGRVGARLIWSNTSDTKYQILIEFRMSTVKFILSVSII